MTNTIPSQDHRQQEIDQQAPTAAKVKKQARRRTHTSRPYQERLLNMAEARREIVTALKIHRATMRHHQQQSAHQHQELLRQPPLQLQQQQQQQETDEQQQVQVVFQDYQSQAVEEEASLQMSYASFFANPLRNDSPLAHWIAAGSYSSSSPVLPYDLTPPELMLPTAMGGVESEISCQGLEHLVHSLPAQPLGLNLSFQGFGVSVTEDAEDCEDLFGVPVAQSSPAAVSSSYSAYSPPAMETTHAHGSPAPSATDDAEKQFPLIDAPAAALIPVLDDGETMMVQSSAGEMQGVVEWSDEATAADMAAASAWWSRIFDGMESGQPRAPPNAEDVAAEWLWLCGDDVGVVVGEQGAVTGGEPTTPDVLGTTMHVDGGELDFSCCYEGGRSRSDVDGEDITLPLQCLDSIIRDTEGWDGEWLSCLQ